MVVILRYLDDEWNIQQRLVRVKTLAKSILGEEVARELIEVFSVQLSVSSARLLAAMRDQASVNGVVMRALKVIFPNLVNISTKFGWRVLENTYIAGVQEFALCQQCKSSTLLVVTLWNEHAVI